MTAISDSPLVGLTLKCFPKEGYLKETRANFQASMAPFLAALQADHGARVRFFPFYEASDWPDTRALADILAKAGSPGTPIDIRRWANLTDLRREIAACDAFIGVRFHSVLLAVQAGVPVLAISYAEKTANFMTENGLERFVIRYEDVTAGALRERWDRLWGERATLKEEFQRLCAAEKMLAERQFDLVSRLLASSSPVGGRGRGL